MRNLLSATEERVYFKDRQSRFLLVSAGWAAAYAPGQAPAELIGKTDFDVFAEDHAAAAYADEQQIMRTGEPVVGKVERETYPGRADSWVSTTKVPLRDSGGRIIGTFGISRDVTAQITAERALARQADQLRVRGDRLAELDQLKDEFIGLVSHELRTPLTSIIGYVELLREENRAGTDIGHFIEVIKRNAERLQRLVADLLFVSGIEAGRVAMEFRGADLAQIAAGTVADLRPAARRKHIDLSLSAEVIPRFPVDAARIAQVLGNVISNAVKFTPDGGKVEVSVTADDHQAVITVADTGSGISAEDQKWVFDRFFRTTIAIQQAIPGTGLGLTIAKAIVEAHGGTITVHGNAAGGATFRIRLPVRSAPPPAADHQGRISQG